MSSPRVIISGAGIAGAILAYWLGKHNYQVLVIERSSSKSAAGQIIDVEGPARDIVTRMGLLEEVKANGTHESGIQFVDGSDRILATFPVGMAQGISNEIEVMRPALARILLAAANDFPNVEFRYEHSIQSIQQGDTSVIVEIQNKAQDGIIMKEESDILVACDGLRSSTRNMILPPDQRESCLKSCQVFAAFFTVPAEPRDRPYARQFSAPGRRGGLTKPWTATETSAYLTCAKFHQSLRDARESRDMERQKAAVEDVFKGAGGQTERLVKGMRDAENFYFEEITQVKLSRWWHGRCVLLGDTAYCPSPLTGQGTNLAILGAYVLASKLVKNKENLTKGFQEYEQDMRPYVDKVQPIPLGGYLPLLINPDTSWGVWLLRKIVEWVAWSALLTWLPDQKNVSFDLPDF